MGIGMKVRVRAGAKEACAWAWQGEEEAACACRGTEKTQQATTGLVGITSELSPGIVKGEVLLTVCPARLFATCLRSAIAALAPVARPSGCPAILRR